MVSESIRLVATESSDDPFSWIRTLLRLPDNLWSPTQGRVANVVGPSLPAGTKSTEVLPSLLPEKLIKSNIQVLKYTTEEAHAGRITVFGTAGGSVDFKDAFGVFDSETLLDVFGHGESHTKEPELIIFTPGLNQWHEPRLPTETTSPERLIHYSNILGGLRMINMNMGTSCDQDTLIIDESLGSLLDSLPPDIAPAKRGNDYAWNPRQFDTLQLIISERNIMDNPVKENYRLIFRAKVPVVLLCYSRAAVEVAAALRKFVQDEVDRGRAKSAVEASLYEYVTVVTIGNGTQTYVDGPRYIHIYAINDPIPTLRGVTESSSHGAGRDAVFLVCPTTPYAKEAFDNHNFGSITGQYLSLVMHLNKVSGFRELYDLALKNTVSRPTHDELCAMIMLTRGYEWLWSVKDAWEGIPHGALPSYDGAWNILRQRCDESWLIVVDKLIKSENAESYEANQ